MTLRSIWIVTACIAVAGCVAWADRKRPPPTLLLQITADTVGTPISCPYGAAQVSSNVLIMVPGTSPGLYRRDVPLYARMLAGRIEVDSGKGVRKTYCAGDEASCRKHLY